MMTFKEYLIESTIMSTDALKQAMSDYEQRGIGKPEARPTKKRLKQMDKRKARRSGEEEEEPKVQARLDRMKGMEHRQGSNRGLSRKRNSQRAGRNLRSSYGIGGSRSNARQIGEEDEEVKKAKRGRKKTPEMLKRQSEQPLEKDKPKRGRKKTPEMLKRQSGL